MGIEIDIDRLEGKFKVNQELGHGIAKEWWRGLTPLAPKRVTRWQGQLKKEEP
jgi:hypothetical protein